jgi:simple sugar transport system ATP-binding protein
MPPLIELKDICKYYPLVKANNKVNLQVEKGEIHAIIGENGAGKSTLMNILYGMIKPDSGRIVIRGQHFPDWNTSIAIQQGIGMVHQSFKLIPPLTIAENIILGSEPTNGPLLRLRLAIKQIKTLAKNLQIEINPEEPLSLLSASERQQVEILKTLYREAEIIILDEPTSILAPHQIKQLYNILLKLQKKGKTIILISHKLSEVLYLANRITVMRHGKTICCLKRHETSEKKLAKLIMGDYKPKALDKVTLPHKDAILKVLNIYLKDRNGIDRLRGLTFELENGEVLGIAGIANNGQPELINVLIGLDRPQSGQIRLFDHFLTQLSTRKIKEMGIAFIPEEVQHLGLINEFSLKENFILGWHRSKNYCSKKILKKRDIEENAKKLVTKFSIYPSNIDLAAQSLSGGNQQRLIIARELGHNPQLIIACQPTQGLDVASARFAHNAFIKERNKGKAILLISNDLDEIFELCDRIAVIKAGRIISTFLPSQISPEELGLLMTGSIN